jgi:hypothetical protein
MSKRKSFFAQDNNKHPDHKAAYFWTLDEARDWLVGRGGGTIKKRNAAVVHVFGDPVRVWGEVENV